MLRLIIFSTLITLALAHPAIRTIRDTDGEANQNTLANPTEVNEDGTTLEERFGYGRHHGHGYGQPGYGRPYGGHYPQGGYYGHQGAYYPQQHGHIYPGGGYQPIVPLGK